MVVILMVNGDVVSPCDSGRYAVSHFSSGIRFVVLCRAPSSEKQLFSYLHFCGFASKCRRLRFVMAERRFPFRHFECRCCL
jgi:hypothetical protein